MMEKLIRFLREWTLPVAITVGVVSYLLFTRIPALDSAADTLGVWFDHIFPFTVFLTLWATFCKVDFRSLRPARWTWAVVAVQLLLAGVFFITALYTEGNARVVATGAMACVLAPCATAAPVVTAKLGGNINTMTAFVLVSSLLASLTIPFCATMLAPQTDEGWAGMFREGSLILLRVSVVLVLPLFLGWLVRHTLHGVYEWVVRHSDLPFYLWCLALAITSGVTVQGIDHSHLSLTTLLILAAVSLVICLVQFAIGRRMGRSFRHRTPQEQALTVEPDNRIESGQAMGQKNTALIIWATSAFLHPAAALAPGCYVLWQNIVNSVEIHHVAKRKKH